MSFLGSRCLRNALPCSLRFLFSLPNQGVWILHFVCWKQLGPYVRSGRCTSWLSLCPSQLSLLCMCQLDGVWPAAYTKVWAGLVYTAFHSQLSLVPCYSLATLNLFLTLRLVVPMSSTPSFGQRFLRLLSSSPGCPRTQPPASQLLLFMCSLASLEHVESVPHSFSINSHFSDATASFTWTRLSVRHLQHQQFSMKICLQWSHFPFFFF